MNTILKRLYILEYGKRAKNKGRLILYTPKKEYIKGVSSIALFDGELYWYFDYSSRYTSAWKSNAIFQNMLDEIKELTT